MPNYSGQRSEWRGRSQSELHYSTTYLHWPSDLERAFDNVRTTLYTFTKYMQGMPPASYMSLRDGHRST
jgi:hypothetical protein